MNTAGVKAQTGVSDSFYPRHPAVWLLGISQVVGYGTLYYAFAILAADMARELGWPVAWIYGALSAGLLAGGLVAPSAGRAIDRHGAPLLMALGTVGASVALAATALAPNATVFMVGMVVVQVAATYAQYDAAFACLVQMGPAQARLRITHLTLIAGFASTLFWPLTTMLHEIWSWRTVLLAYAAMNLIVCLPIHLGLRRMVRRLHAATMRGESGSMAIVMPLLSGDASRRAFILVTAGFTVAGFVLGAVLAQVVPLLENLGVGEYSVACAALFGPAQVLIRFVTMVFASTWRPLSLTLLSVGFLVMAMLLPLASGPSVAGAAAFAILFGFASGLTSIVRGTLPLALFGSLGYGTRMGKMAAFRLVVNSVAPFALAELVGRVGAQASFLAMGAIALAGLAAFLMIGRMVREAIADAARV